MVTEEITYEMDSNNSLQNIVQLLYHLSHGVPVDAIECYPKEITKEVRKSLRECLPEIVENYGQGKLKI